MNFSLYFAPRAEKYFLTFLLVLSFLIVPATAQQTAVRSGATETAPARQTPEVPIVTKTLANGLEIIVLPDSAVPLVTVEIAVRNGSFTEPPEFNGLSHLFEHMFFKTNEPLQRLRARKPFPSDLYILELQNLGLFSNGRTQEELVNYYYTTTSPNWQTALRVVRDSIRYPVFEEREFAQEKEVVIGELDRNEASPFFYLDRTLKDKLFYKYPTRKNIGGTRSTINAATTEQMRLIQNRYYVPNNSAIVITGDVKPADVFKKAEELFGDWARRKIDPFVEFPLVEHPPLAKSEGEVIEKIPDDGEQKNVFIQIGWHGPSIGKDDAATYAADVFSYILTQPNSRFQRKLVDSGLTNSVGIGYYTQRNVGPIQLSATTTPDKAQAAVRAIYEEIAAFNRPDYFTDDELESAKTILAANDLFEREKLSDYAHTLSFWWSSTGIDYFRGYQKNLNAASRRDINRYVTTYIQNKPHVALALISPNAQVTAKLTPEVLIGK